jgi:outer membrane protein OmpA-like peptidoglycan-associated protein
MVYYLSHYWFWLFAIFVVGVTNGFLTRAAEKRKKISAWLVWFALAFGVGLPLALLSVLNGRAGVWLETGLASFACFIAGAALGALARRGSLSEHKYWALGLALGAVLWWAGNIFGMPRLEAGLRQSAEAAVAKAGGDPKNLQVEGRDVLLSNNAADRALLAAEIGKVDGVRLVLGADKVSSVFSRDAAHEENAMQQGSLEPSRSRQDSSETPPPRPAGEVAETKIAPAPVPAPAPAAPETPKQPEPRAKINQAGIGAGDAAQTPAERAKAAQIRLDRLSPAGPLAIAACQSAIDAEQTLQPIEFRGRSAAVHRPAAQTLDRIAGLLQRCPEAKAEIAVRAEDDSGDLARRRAERLAQYLIAEGVAGVRLSTAVRGAGAPEAGAGAGGQSGGVEFVLK